LYERSPGRATKKALYTVPATALRAPSNAVSVAQQALDHERRRRDDSPAAVKSLGVDEVDGHGSANTNHTDRLFLRKVVRTDHGNKTINPKPPRLEITAGYPTRAPLR
jgi:hypothetical protein